MHLADPEVTQRARMRTPGASKAPGSPATGTAPSRTVTQTAQCSDRRRQAGLAETAGNGRSTPREGGKAGDRFPGLGRTSSLWRPHDWRPTTGWSAPGGVRDRCSTPLDQVAQTRFVNGWAVALDYPVEDAQLVGGRDMAPTTRADADDESAEGVSPDLSALYLAHREAMYGMARSLLRADNHHHAEDVVQQVMLSLMPTPPTDVRNWEAFLVNAVRLKVYDFWKSAARRRERLTLEDARPVGDERHAPEDLHPDPAVVVEESERRDATVVQVRAAMTELARRDPQAAYVFRQVKQLERTSEDVAEELGVSSSRVRQHVMKARKQLRRILDAEGGEP